MPPSIRHRSRYVYIDLQPLVSHAVEVTELTDDIAASGSSLTVKDIDGFAVNKILLIGELGVEGSEIIETHAATGPTGTTVTLASGCEFAHSAGTKVYIIEYDQVEISHADTVAGAKSELAIVDLQADELYQIYTDLTETSGFYFARFKDSVNTLFSAYSDNVPYGGYASTTVGYAINFALKRNGMSTFADDIDLQFCLEELNDFLNEWQGKQKRWPEYFYENANIGNITAGVPLISLPTDIYDNTSNQSLLGLRIGDGAKLTWTDPIEFEERKEGDTQTQVKTEASATDTTLVVDDASDFADTGSLSFYVSGTLYTITYTAVNRTTNTFSGIPASGTGAITVTVPVDTYIHQGASFGEPSHFTVRGGNIEFDPIPNASYHNNNVYADYWTVATAVDGEADDLDISRFHAAKYWLAWKIRMQRTNMGMLDMNDGFYLKYRDRLGDAIRNKPKVMTHKSRPFNHFGVTD